MAKSCRQNRVLRAISIAFFVSLGGAKVSSALIETIDDSRSNHTGVGEMRGRQSLFTVTLDTLNKAIHPYETPGPTMLLLALHAPWCRHCPPLLKNMEEAAHTLSLWWKENMPDMTPDQIRVQFGKIDATVEKTIADKFNITVYPTLKLVMSMPYEIDSSPETETSNTDTMYIYDYRAGMTKSQDSLIRYTLHYWLRFIFSPAPYQNTFAPVIWMDSAHRLETFLNTHREVLLRTSEEEDYWNNVFMNLVDEFNGGVIFTMCHFENNDQDGELAKHYEVELESLAEQMLATSDKEEGRKIQNKMALVAKALIDSKGLAHDTLQSNFEQAANDMSDREDIAFFALPSSSCRQLGFEDTSSIRAIHPPFDKDAFHRGPAHHVSVTEDTVMEFVKRESTPRLIWFDRNKNASIVFQGDFTVHVCLFVKLPSKISSGMHGEVSSEIKHAILSMKRAANSNTKSDNVYVIIPHTEQRIVNYFNIKSFPTLMITDMRKKNGMLKYLLHSDDILKRDDSIISFVQKFHIDNLKPALKSQPLSEKDTNNPVKVVKGDSFQSMVMEGNKHTLVNFYAPWCGHCKHLTSKWNELALIFARSDYWTSKIDVMKMDATENELDHPAVDVLVFPTIYFFPRGDKKRAVRYNGNGTDPSDFIEWVERHEKNDVNIESSLESDIVLDASQSIESIYDEL